MKEMQGVATRLLTRFKQGVITLAKTPTAPPDDPLTPGAPTTTTTRYRPQPRA